MLEYAVLRSHSGLPSLRGCLYYSQRIVTHPAIRRAAARIIAAGINMLERRPEPFAVAAGAEALRQMQTDGYAMLPDMLRPKQID